MATTETPRRLAMNITASNVWTLMHTPDDQDWFIDVSGARAIVASLRAQNLGANNATIEFGIASHFYEIANVLPNLCRVVPPTLLKPNEHYLEPPGRFRDVIGILNGLYCRAVGTSPNVTFQAGIYVITPS